MDDASDTADDKTTETIPYQFDPPAETWRAWTDTIPRSTPVYRRLIQLIEQDLRATQRDGTSEMEAASVSVLASRIRIRSMQALGAVRDGEEVDTETAIEQLEEVIELANTLES